VQSAARILVVDDEPIEMALMQMTLEKAGHTVVALTSPKEAVERVSASDFDVVLTDLMMNELSGLEVCERVLGARSDTRVVVVTGHGSMETAIEATHTTSLRSPSSPTSCTTSWPARSNSAV
jgi:two-component system response regulator HydG